MNLKCKKVVFLGDSITQGVGVADMKNRYDCRLAEKYGFNAINFGLSGTRLAYQKVPTLDHPMFDLSFCGRAETIPSDADIIIVFGGTNDFGHGDAPFGTYEDRTPVTYCGAVDFLITFLKNKNPNAKLIFMTPASRKSQNSEACKSPDKKILKDYVDAMIDITKKHGVPVLDLFRKLGLDITDEEICNKYTADGLHFNDLGHSVIADALGKFLESL